jgi:hypothetical protein
MRKHSTHFDDCGCRSERYELRIRELETKLAALQPDASLGRAVRRMEGGDALARLQHNSKWAVIGVRSADFAHRGGAESPEAAMQAAGLWEEPGT